MRKAAAECLGTFLLVFFAVGSAVVGIKSSGNVGVALAFGLVLLALVYAIGPITGCHVNPAVTLGLLMRKGVTTTEACYYWGAQFVGGILGGAMLKLMVSSFGVADETGALGSNSWGDTISVGGDFVFEVILTFLLVFVVLLVTARQASPGFAGLAIGLVLTGDHLAGIPRRRHVSEPGPLTRPGAVRRRGGTVPGVALHPGPAGRRRNRRVRGALLHHRHDRGQGPDRRDVRLTRLTTPAGQPSASRRRCLSALHR